MWWFGHKEADEAVTLYLGELKMTTGAETVLRCLNHYAEITEVEIVEKAYKNGDYARYALIKLPSMKKAKKCIALLKKGSLTNSIQEPRPYHFRCYNNENRARAAAFAGNEVRRGDRRRQEMVQESNPLELKSDAEIDVKQMKTRAYRNLANKGL
ncbi:MAG: hypothetical protein HQL49_02695 [Gammaproteobacteria bacterium]|nr:hypothetical protein [Gammaproteobacteria bacterium]